MKYSPGIKKSAGCPQWILDGVRAIREQATSRGTIASNHKHDSAILEKIRDS